MNKKYEGKPIIIGIAGGSGSGKSTFAKLLTDKLQPLKVENISTDHFFKMPLRPKALLFRSFCGGLL